ncbi:MAG: antibiotic biosynthesis monooxygenase [Brevinematales bacterium]|nr:antibiotic biosynthesis monooxygenase [Brevinematales bacterium]
MIVTIVNVWVKPEYRDKFIEATIENHKNSIQEKGNLRFDFLQDKNDPCKFTLYEAYESEEAAKAHKDTPHYKKWKETVENFMARPREGLQHKVIAPEDISLWK